MREIWDWDSGMYLGDIEEAAHTYNVVGNMNEHQLTIGETTFGGLPSLAGQTARMDYGNLIWVTLQRAKTARQAIALMGNLTATYGYASEGESFSIADPNEVWVLEMIGKGPGEVGTVWVAVRIPDGYVSGHANQARYAFLSLRLEFTLAHMHTFLFLYSSFLHSLVCLTLGLCCWFVHWIVLLLHSHYISYPCQITSCLTHMLHLATHDVSRPPALDCRIRTFPQDDPENCMYAKDVVTFAVKKELYPASSPAADFSFSDTYDPVGFGGARFCEVRVWDFFQRVADGMELYLDYVQGRNLTNRMPLYVHSRVCVPSQVALRITCTLATFPSSTVLTLQQCTAMSSPRRSSASTTRCGTCFVFGASPLPRPRFIG